MAQRFLVYQSLWAMERRRPDRLEWTLDEKLAMIRAAGFDGAGVRFADFQYAKTVTALQNPRVKKRLEDSGLRMVGGAPERPGDLIRTETEPWARVIKANNIKAE